MCRCDPLPRSTYPPNVIIMDEMAGVGNGNGVLELSEVDAFYALKGYPNAASGPSDAQVMYYSGYHGARKAGCGCGSGKWIMYGSKCGQWERIEHVWDQLNGSTYGNPIRYYK